MTKRYIQKLNTTKPYSQTAIFILCVLFLFGAPLMKDVPGYLPRILLSLLVIFALVAMEKISTIILLFGLITILIGWIAKISSLIILEYVTEFTTNMFLFWMVGSNVKRIMRLKEVFIYNLFEAVNGFFLMAIAFTSFAFFLQKHYPLSFISPQEILFGKDLVYFTIITLTTTGYGDVLPSTPAAKDLAALMAISGQFYVAIIMAVMVGKYANKK